MSTLSFYDISVPVFRQILGATGGQLAKASAHCADKGVDPATLINSRLFADMFPFNVQVGQALGHSVGAIRRLRGENVPIIPASPPPDTFDGLRKAIADGLAYLETVTPADLEGAAERDVKLEFPGGRSMSFKGKDYLLGFAMPNFYFHSTTAYDILRHNGVVIGKGDFMRPPAKAA